MSDGRARFAVRGLRCSECARTIARALESTEGVSEADVLVSLDEVVVEYDPDSVTETDLRAAVGRAGFSVRTETVAVTFEESPDEGAVDDVLEYVDGVFDVTREDDEARIEYNPVDVTAAELRERLDAGGLELAEGDGTPDSDPFEAVRTAESRWRYRLFRLGALASMLLIGLFAAAVFFPEATPDTVPGTDLPMAWSRLAVATVVVFGLGYPFYRRGLAALAFGRAVTTDLLVAIAVIALYLYSVVAFFGPAVDTPYFASAVFVLTVATAGDWLIARSNGIAAAPIDGLGDEEADNATLLYEDGTERQVPVHLLEPGIRMKVRPGERIPTDGVVVRGSSAIDESPVTGREGPVEHGPGDRVIGGTVNGNGILIVQATAVGDETTLRQLIAGARNAQRGQPAIYRLADQLSAVFGTVALLFGFLAGAVWYVNHEEVGRTVLDSALWTPVAGGPISVGGTATPAEMSVIVFVAVLLAVSPRAFGLVASAVTTVSTTVGLRNGLLFGDGGAIGRLGTVDSAALSKNGAVMEGNVRVTDTVVVDADVFSRFDDATGDEPDADEGTDDPIVAESSEEEDETDDRDAMTDGGQNEDDESPIPEPTVISEGSDDDPSDEGDEESDGSGTDEDPDEGADDEETDAEETDDGETSGEEADDENGDGDERSVEPGEFGLVRAAASAVGNRRTQMAMALREAADRRGIAPVAPDRVESLSGGVRAIVSGNEVVVGTRSALRAAEIDPGPAIEGLERFETTGKRTVVVAVEGTIAGVIATVDDVREEAGEVVDYLKDRDIEVHLLTEDGRLSATHIAEELGIDPVNVHADQSPDESADTVARLQEEGPAVAIGTRWRDSPMLSTAAVGVSLGVRTDVGSDPEDVTAIDDDIGAVRTAMRIADAARSKARTNFRIAAGYNLLLFPLAALALFRPTLAMLAGVVGAYGVLKNGLRLHGYDPDGTGGPLSLFR